MTDLQKYALTWNRDDGSTMRPTNYGTYVLAADAEAAIAAAIADVGAKWRAYTLADDEDSGAYLYRAGVEQGQRDMLAKAIAAVEEVSHDFYCASLNEQYNRPCNCPQGNALDALHALRQPEGPIEDLTDEEADAYYEALQEKP